MSDEKEVADQAEDQELNELLDSALKDFDEPVKPLSALKKDDTSTSAVSNTEVSEEDGTVEEVWTEDFIKQTADQFKRNLEDLMQNDSNSEMGESFKRVAQTIAGAISESTGEDGPIPDFQSAINQALKDLQNVPNITETDLAAMFGQASLEDGGGDIFPFIQGVMQSLLSKDVLYPSLKDVVDKYPAWLTEKRTSLPPTDLANYEKQLDLMKKVCTEMESETENDTEEVKKKRFKQVLGLLQEMQTCGPPPEDLVSDQQPFLQLDPEGNHISPALPGMDDAQNCSVM